MNSRAVAFSLLLLACGNGTTPVAAPAATASVAPAPVPVPVSSAAPLETGLPSWPYQKPLTARSERGMVVTDEARATRVGKDMLAAGGNAVDAAVAVAFALAVTFPTAGNIGGGGFAVVKHGADVRALDFRETAPKAATHDMYLGKDGKKLDGAHTGVRSVGVPGSVAGLWELHAKYGKKKWTQVLAPAIALARNGFEVDDAFVDTVRKAKDSLAKHPVSAALFLPHGEPPKKGTTFANPDLASTLERISADGPKGFYAGINAKNLAAQMKAEGGLLTAADLASYKAKWREPLSFSFHGRRVVSMPPPSSGGVTLAMMAHILEGYDLKTKGFQTTEALHFTFEAMRRAFAARNTKLGDPDFVKMPIDVLLSKSWADAQRSTIDAEKATPSSQIDTAGPASGVGPHTTHFSVVDEHGDAVALTTTVNHWFGAGVTAKDGGYVLNNEMDDFASVPGQPNAFGLVQGEANAIAPGKRMLSSMSPTIVFDEAGKVQLVVGAAGGPTIITAVFQEILGVLEYDKPIGDAVFAPRFHMQHMPDVVVFEANGLSAASSAALESHGYELKERDHLADAPAIGREGSTWIGVAEPRRLGGLAEGL